MSFVHATEFRGFPSSGIKTLGLTPVSFYYPSKLAPEDRATLYTLRTPPPLCSLRLCCCEAWASASVCFQASWPRGLRHRCATPAPLPVFLHMDHVDRCRWAERLCIVEISAVLAGQVWTAPMDFPRRSVRSLPCAPVAIATLPEPITNPLPRAQVLWFRRDLHSIGWRGGALSLGRLMGSCRLKFHLWQMVHAVS